jgi:hypothetical protein
LVHKGTEHVRIVIKWHQALDDSCEGPKCLFFGHDLKQPANHEVEALTVTKLIVSNAVGSANAFNCICDILTCCWLASFVTYATLHFLIDPDIAEELIVLESARHVHCDLVFILSRVFTIV